METWLVRKQQYMLLFWCAPLIQTAAARQVPIFLASDARLRKGWHCPSRDSISLARISASPRTPARSRHQPSTIAKTPSSCLEATHCRTVARTDKGHNPGPHRPRVQLGTRSSLARVSGPRSPPAPLPPSVLLSRETCSDGRPRWSDQNPRPSSRRTRRGCAPTTTPS